MFKKILIAFLFSAGASLAQTNEIIYLIDNSGSMAGYYDEQSSSFKTFVKFLIKNTASKNDEVMIMPFSKTETGRGISSPNTAYDGNAASMNLNSLISGLTISRGKDGKSGNTDLIEALDGAINNISGQTGIIWLITDNINDRSGTGDDSYLNTLNFYQKLRNDNNIQKILLYPVPEKITYNNSVHNGYVAYAMVYSKTGLSQQQIESYDKLLRKSGIKQKPITLKPLDIGTVILKPKITQSKISEGKLYYDGNALRGYGFEEGERVQETFTDLILKSNLYPYKIESARLNVSLKDFQSSDYSVTSMGTQSISPSTVSNVSPEGEVTGFTLLFNMPEINPKFSFNTIFNDEFTIGGNLVLEVTQVDIELEETYINSFRELFALESIPEIFQPVLKDKKITTTIPLEIKMQYGPWRIYVLVGLIVLLLALIVLIIILILKKKCFRLIIDESNEQDICLSKFSSYNVTTGYSPVLGKLTKSWTGGIMFQYSKFTMTPGRKIRLTNELPIQVEYEESDYRKETVSLMIRSSDGKKNFEDSVSSEEKYF